MDLKVHDGRQDEKSIWTEYTVNFVDPLLRRGKKEGPGKIYLSSLCPTTVFNSGSGNREIIEGKVN